MVEGCTVKIDRKRDGVAGGGSEHRIRILCETVKQVYHQQHRTTCSFTLTQRRPEKKILFGAGRGMRAARDVT